MAMIGERNQVIHNNCQLKTKSFLCNTYLIHVGNSFYLCHQKYIHFFCNLYIDYGCFLIIIN